MKQSNKPFQSTEVHALVIVGGVAAALRAQDKTMNLKGTQTDKINAENFCYNYKNYVLHPTIQLSESDADKIKKPPQILQKRRSTFVGPDSIPEGPEPSAPENDPKNQNPGISDPKSVSYGDQGPDYRRRESKKFFGNHTRDQTMYDPEDPGDKQFIADSLRKKTLKRLAKFFKRAPRQHCVIFLSGHGLSKARFVINDRVKAFLSFEEVLQAWDASPKHVWQMKDQYGQPVDNRSHLLIIIDACKSGSWVHALQSSLKRPNQDVSVQASSSFEQLSYDDESGAGGYFLNNLLFINGLKDISYNDNYRRVDSQTKQRLDVQRPSFFSRYPLLSQEFRLRIGFNSWQELEWRLSLSPVGSFTSEGGDVLKGTLKSVQLHGPGEKRLANGRVERGVFRNDKLHGVGHIEWDGMRCHGVFDQGQLVEIYSAKLSSGAEITMFDSPKEETPDAKTLAKRGHSLIIQDDMVKELKLMNQTNQCSAVYEWGLTRFSNSDVLREMYKNGVPHGNSFYEQKEGGLIHRIFSEGALCESYSVDPDGNVEVNYIPDWDMTKFEKTLAINDGAILGGKMKSSKLFSVFRGKLELLFPRKNENFWKILQFSGNSGQVLKGDGCVYEGPSSDKVPSGFGKFIDKFGNTYEGFWKNGLPHGKGTYTNATDGSVYEGLWSDGMRSGLGSMKYSDGSSFTGLWKLDLIWGQGRYISYDRSEYEGLLFQPRFGSFLNKEYPETAHLTDRKILNPVSPIYGLCRLTRGNFAPIYPPQAGVPNHYDAQFSKMQTNLGYNSPHRPLPTDPSENNKSGPEPYDFGDNRNNTYDGEIVRNFEYGFGRTTTLDHQVFEGEFRNKMLLVENQSIRLYNDEVYFGSALYYPVDTEPDPDNLHVYKGLWEFMFFHGFGRMENTATGELYEGEFRESSRSGSGKLIFPNGDSYEGEFVKNQMTGKGKYRTTQGAEFQGSFFRDKLVVANQRIEFEDHSQYVGSCLFRRRSGPDDHLNKVVYRDSWVFDKFHGFGRWRGPNGVQYIGNFYNNLRHGEGRMVLPDGDEIEGRWHYGYLIVPDQTLKLENNEYYFGEVLMSELTDQNLEEFGDETETKIQIYKNRFVFAFKHGKGILYKPGEFLYHGEFNFDKCQGRGSKLYATGHFYEGQFFLGTEDAHGQMTMPNGDVYIGDFSYGAMQGMGIYTLPSGKQFFGEFSGNRLIVHKQTILTPDGNQYFGSCTMSRMTPEEERETVSKNPQNTFMGAWKYHRKEKSGILRYPDGAIYDGAFYEDQRRHFGRMVYPDGSVYQGQFENDKFDFFGKLIRPNLSFIEGQFRNGYFERGNVRIVGPNNSVFKGEFLYKNFDGAEFIQTKFGDKVKSYLSDHLSRELTTIAQCFPKRTTDKVRGALLALDQADEQSYKVSNALNVQNSHSQTELKIYDELTDLNGGWAEDEEYVYEGDKLYAMPINSPNFGTIDKNWNFVEKAAEKVKDIIQLSDIFDSLKSAEVQQVGLYQVIENDEQIEEIEQIYLGNWVLDDPKKDTSSGQLETRDIKPPKNGSFEPDAPANKIQNLATNNAIKKFDGDQQAKYAEEDGYGLLGDAENDSKLSNENSSGPYSDGELVEENQITPENTPNSTRSIDETEIDEKNPLFDLSNKILVQKIKNQFENRLKNEPENKLEICVDHSVVVEGLGSPVGKISDHYCAESPDIVSKKEIYYFNGDQDCVDNDLAESPVCQPPPHFENSFECVTADGQVRQSNMNETSFETWRKNCPFQSNVEKSPSLPGSNKIFVKHQPTQIYQGFVLGNARHGQGKLRLTNGSIYIGEFDHGFVSGEGFLKLTDGSAFQGRFINGRPNGLGTLTGVDGGPVSGYFMPAAYQIGAFDITTNFGEIFEFEWKAFQKVAAELSKKSLLPTSNERAELKH